MISKLLSTLIVLLISNFAFSNEPILVTESTIVLDMEQNKELFFSFAEGDKVVFNLQMVKGKHIKEVEVIEMPSNTILTEFKVTGISKKHIQIRNKGIYKFRFYSSSITRRVCKIKIHRIPANESTKNFNTNWKWKTLRDTTYTTYQEDSLVGYTKKRINKTLKELVKIDTTITELLSKKERVHSKTAIGKSQYSYINVFLPKNKYFPNRLNPHQSSETIAWSHWLGVGEKSQKDYDKSNQNFMSGVKVIGSMSGYGALANLAITGISMFNDTSIGDNVNYRFITVQNGIENVFNSGNGTSDSGRNTQLLQGGFTIELFNDNFREGIDVHLKLIVVQIHKIWKDKAVIEEKEEPEYVTLNKTRMNINETKVRIPIE